MASSTLQILILGLALCVMLISPAHSSTTCKSQKFTGKKSFSNCSDLPVLSASLHWTYDASNSSLAIAFTAPPSKPNGWVAWAINPTGTGMVGAQSLIAVKHSNGSVSVMTFNISSYRSIVPSKLSFDVWGLSAESVDGNITIFATVKVPEKAKTLNQVWQVGSGVNQTNGFLIKHDFAPENLNAKGTLNLVTGTTGGDAPSMAPAPATGSASSPSGSSNSTGNGKNGGVSLMVRGTIASIVPSFKIFLGVCLECALCGEFYRALDLRQWLPPVTTPTAVLFATGTSATGKPEPGASVLFAGASEPEPDASESDATTILGTLLEEPVSNVIVEYLGASNVSVLLISPAQSLTCTSQTFANKLYSYCLDLPTLNAYLHWNYDAANSSLSVAFTAPPSKPDGWVSWAVNPTGTGMAGAQALIAVKQPNDSVTVQTYKINSYSSIVPSKLSFEVWNLSAHAQGAEITIFATVKVPEKTKKLNHLWQVGPGINEGTGFIVKHDMSPANLGSVGTLNLVAGTNTNGTAGAGDGGASGSESNGGGIIALFIYFQLSSILFLLCNIWPLLQNQRKKIKNSSVFSAMASLVLLLLQSSLWVTLVLLISPAQSLTCTTQKFSNNKLYSQCLDLPSLGSYLHWTYDSSNSSLSIAFIAPPAKSDGWISWAINPTGTGMVGSQSLIAFKQSDGSMVVKTYDIKSYSSLVEGKLSFDVWDTSAEYSGGVMRIFAKVKLPEKASSVNHVWQVGPSVASGRPDAHEFQGANLNAKGKLSLNGSQISTTTTSVDSRTKKKNIHGILNAVSWGILFPLGVIIARYLRTFESADPAWFYLHAFCQTSSYAIGVAGWATGIKLGSESKGIEYTGHRNIGIALFSLATLQIFALFIRPKKDHKYRFYWNIYHHGLGYAIIVLGILNVFKGINILSPAQKWKSAYIICIAVLGGIALLLEVITWIVVLRKKSRRSTKPYDGYNNGQGSQRPLGF
ncbi:hypothetical protein G4B88_003760 [Cannabis sativa]|uniref:Cytochrome b561 and DOMON domain-containing protein n=1 Tax=Cannabis sativa TaxID=3483 RepID=A0A7J6FA52_CANSA|nr:hypothetical protein G4B88_003760 [Cannabis sativa]